MQLIIMLVIGFSIIVLISAVLLGKNVNAQLGSK
jgi:hypothetical protein